MNPREGQDNQAEFEGLEEKTERAAKFIFFSFFHSQGDPALQSFFIIWFHNKYPNFKLTNEEEFESTFKKFSQKARSFFERYGGPKDAAGKPDHSTELIDQDGLSMTNTFAKVVNYNYPILSHSDFEKIQSVLPDVGLMDIVYANEYEGKSIDQIILDLFREVDSKHLNKGRSRLDGVSDKSSFGDKRMSQLCEYVILGSNKTTPEFVEFFSEMKCVFKEEYQKNKILFDSIINQYCKFHPGKRESIERALTL